MRVALPLALLALQALAGCASEPADAGDGPADQVSIVTDPRDLSYLDGAQPGSHVHDYWGGRDRVPVLQVDGSTWSACYGGCEDGATGAWRRPPEGAIVPQGTRWVNGTFTFTPHADNDARQFELWVRTAADGSTRRVQDLVPGEPFSIETTPEQDDPPHYVLSLWQFEVLARNSTQRVVFRGDFTWDVEAVRGWPLTPYPPHPDRWGGATSLRLLQENRSAVLYSEEGGGSVCYMGAEGCPGWHALPDRVVVPHDAATVQVRVLSTVPTMGLEFHGADTWSLRPVAGRLEGAENVFDIDVASTLGDSPYAAQSLWEFRVRLDQPSPTEAWAGRYGITVTAFK